MQTFKFKGSRRYVHGTDMFNALTTYARQQLGKDAWVRKVAFRQPTAHQLKIVDHPPENAQFACEANLLSPTVSTSVWLVPTEIVVTQSYAYPEDELERFAIPANDQVTTLKVQQVEIDYPFTTIETAVALTKMLNNKLAKPTQGKWLFGQLELQRALPITYNELTVRSVRVFTEKFSVNQLIIDGEPIGTIRFIVGAGDVWN